jgi:trimeric autotransporter adhesin
MADISSLIVEVKAKGVAQTAKELDGLAAEAEKAEGAIEDLNKEQNEGGRIGKNYADQTKKLTDAFKLEAKSIRLTKDEIRILKLEQSGASKEQVKAARAALEYKNQLLAQAKAADIAEKEQRELSAASNVVQGKFKAMKGSTQQVSYQLQDIAVQAQMGTNAFTILGQQGPQLASVFGPGGAVAGAVISFAALLGGVMFAGLKDTSETMEEVEQRATDLAAKLNELSEEDKKVVLRQLTSQLEKSKEALEAQELVITRAKIALDTYATQVESFFVPEEYKELFESLDAQRTKLIELQEEYTSLQDKIDGVSETTNDLIDGLKEEVSLFGLVGRARDLELARIKNATPLQVEEINRLYDLLDLKHKEKEQRTKTAERLKAETDERERANKALEKQVEIEENRASKRLQVVEQAGLSPVERLKEEMAQSLALLEQDRLAAVVAAEIKGQDVFLIEQRYADARTSLTEQTEKKITEIELQEAQQREMQKAAIEQMALTRAASVAGQLSQVMAGAFGEQSAAAKSAFALQQGLAMAQIIVDTQRAAISAGAVAAPLTGLAGFLASAGAVQAMGAISLGIVAGQTLAGLTGRALGGQVRGGESYLVGERGPELLTMGGSGRISSNDQLKAAMSSTNSSNETQVNVNFAIQANDTAGFDRLLQSRRGQIISMINQAVNDRGRVSIA